MRPFLSVSLFLSFINLEEEKCRIAAHLDTLEFDVSLVATEWFLCLFSKSLPSEVETISSLENTHCHISFSLTYHCLMQIHLQTTLRVWDVLFYEGAKVLFHAALAIFKVNVVFVHSSFICFFEF